MKLDVNGTIAANATTDDIARAIEARPSSGDWSILIENDEGGYLQAYGESGLPFRLTCREKDQQVDGKELVSARRLKTILVGYLNHDPHWRSALAWGQRPGNRNEFTLLSAAFDELKQRRTGRGFNAAPGELSPLTILQAMAIIGLFLWSAFALPRWQDVLSHLPFPFDRYVGQLLLLVALVPIGISLVVARSKLERIKHAAGWRSTPGKVIESEVSDSRPDSTIQNPLFENMPRVRYEYTANGRTLVGDRISFGDDTGGANTQATLARYPVGSSVTVYFDPNAPEDCVLEREAPKGLLAGCLSVIAFAIVAVAVVAAIATSLPTWIDTHLPNARNSNVATLAGLMGIALFLLSFAAWRRASRAAGWPVVPGVVTFSGVEEKKGSIGTGTNRSSMTTFQANVAYTYTVDGNTFTGRQLRLDMTMSGAKSAAEVVAAPYPVGAKIEVHYDPANPADAALERSAATPLVPLVLAIALTAFALYQAGVY